MRPAASGKDTSPLRDPLPALLGAGDPALSWFVRRDLLGEAPGPVEALWALPEPTRLVETQQPDGSWRYPGRVKLGDGNANYQLLETYRQLRVLVEMYGCDRRIPALAAAAEYLFSCQTGEGDVRGILVNQTMPYYHGAMLELLVKAGYAEDARTTAALEWLLAVRQDDGGWIVPAQQVPARAKTTAFWQGPALPPDRARPHSHLATGMAVRGLAAHPRYRAHPAARAAGQRLAERLFQPDRYNDRRAASYWLKFQYPFWWTSLVTALDSLSRLGFDRGHPAVRAGLAWFREHQAPDGLWETGYGHGARAGRARAWVGLAVCRAFLAFQDPGLPAPAANGSIGESY